MYPMVRIHELRSLEPTAWTRLLEKDQEMQGAQVTAVIPEKTDSSKLTRYQLSLAGYSDPITLLGKQTNELEAQFYQTIAPYLSVNVPKCWFAHLDDEDSFVVLSEAHDDWTPCYWTTLDVETIIRDISDLHATFWNQDEHLDSGDWPFLLPKRGSRTGRQVINEPSAFQKGKGSGQTQMPRIEGSGAFLSDHTIQSAGPLMPKLRAAALGLEKMRLLGGWPNIFDEQHILAAADLLDDPVPMLQPLQQLPTTLLHGKLSPGSWRFNLFNTHHLLNWEHMTIGPGVFDLVHFIEEFDLLADESGWRSRSCWPVLEETMIDGYLLNMGGKIGSSFNATAVRQAVPAARCLYVLTTWLPRFATWFPTAPNMLQEWQAFNQMCDEELAEAGFGLMVGIRPYLTNLFQRFLTAYRML
jgi:hypothetical protein